MIKDNEEFFSSEVRGVEMRQRPARGMDRSAMSQGSDARPERPMREERDMRDLRSGGRSSSERPRNLRARKADKRRELIYIIILAVEVIALAAIIIVYANIKGKMGDSGKNKSQAGEESSGSSSGGSVNVDNDNFKLTCTKVSITTDSNGNPAALIYFTFVNKTSTPLSMTEVYAPMVSQNGIACETFTTFAETPDEVYNKDVQISNGQSLECAYPVKLKDATSELTLTIHDNYETFSDIGSTVVPIS